MDFQEGIPNWSPHSIKVKLPHSSGERERNRDIDSEAKQVFVLVNDTDESEVATAIYKFTQRSGH